VTHTFLRISLLAHLVFAQSGAAQAQPVLADRLESIAGLEVRESRSVGITAAVAKGGETLLLKAYGKANVQDDTPLSTDTILSIGSVTKQFTAAAVLMLRDEGKLSLDDEITKWLPDFDTRGNKVTLRHMLDHTSGITNLTEMAEVRALRPLGNTNVTLHDLYGVLRSNPFMFPTGSLQAYSNTNFWLLGLVIEKASGMKYGDYIQKRIFEPLGMKRSLHCAQNPDTTPRRAYGHMIRNGNMRRIPEILHTATYAAGALCSTAEDMATWLKALHGGKLLRPNTYKEMITPAKLNDGTRLRYSMGLSVGEDSRGLKYIGHNGGGFGYSAEARWYPEARLAVVVLTNSEPDKITAITADLAAAVIPPPPSPGPFQGDVKLLAGTYKGPGRGKEMTVEVADTAQGLAFTIDGNSAGVLPWVEGWTFRRGDSILVLRRSGKTGPASELRLDNAGGYFILRRQ